MYFYTFKLAFKQSMILKSLQNLYYGGDDMSPKELLYIEDALGHEQYLKTQCLEVESKIQDPQLKSIVSELISKHESIFNQFMSVL